MPKPELQRLVPDAPEALLDILDGARGPVQPPIRSEIFGLQRFAQHGRSLGLTHRAARATAQSATFFPRLRSNIGALREAHRYIGVQASTGYDISPAAEWLLDNFHLIEAQLKEIHEGLPRSYFRTLPVLLDEPLAGLPRIYGVAWAFVAHTDGAFDEDLLTQYLSAYQETRELNLNEMWALPTTLRVVLIENLRRLAEHVATHKAAREVANLVCDRIDSYSLAALDRLLDLLNQRGVGRAFLAQMSQRLQDHRSAAQAQQQAWLYIALPDAAEAMVQQSADQAADNLSVSNAVTSLRAIGDADWPDIIARTSVLMRLMLSSALFEAESAITRDQTLHTIEDLALRSQCGEVVVAQVLLQLMRGADIGRNASQAGARHWLSGPGRPALVRALGFEERGAVLRRALARRSALPAYLGTLLLGTFGLVAWTLQHHGTGPLGADAADIWALLGALLMLFPASEAVVAVINRLIGESARPRPLPRLALAGGIPPEHRVMVVIPALLTDADSTMALAHSLHLHQLANPEPEAQFALLTDWLDAESARVPGDDALLACARQCVRDLNRGCPVPPGAAPRFILLHRERQFSVSEQRWIGWERKRGKLELLVAALAQGSSEAFVDLGEDSRCAADTRYLVTLDSDTRLPPGRLRDLVGVAAHPHNQPRLGAGGRTVLGGYGILQPRVVTPLPAPKDLTLFHWLFAGQCGIDPYSAASSEVYQDVFAEGTFTGKGLLNVAAMHAVMSGRLPEGQVLSHDLLEGSMARCAAVTDIALIEEAPFHADVAASRVHRWTRGDWQLLPFLLGSLLRPQRYPLRAINRWKMFDNLRRSLVAPMSLALLLLSLAGYALSPWAALGLVLAACTAGPLMGAVAGLSPSRDDIAKRLFFRQAAIDLARALLGGVWLLTQLLQQASMAVDAVVRALYRMTISHRHLLQWTTAAAAQASAQAGLRGMWRRHWSAPVVAVLLLAGLLTGATPWPGLALALCLLWALLPLSTWWVSRTQPPGADDALAAPDAALLEGIARDTWRLFERCVGPGDHHLPPDNLQVLPHDMVAHRTSPTNIGLYLLSAACAREFGWIGSLDLITRLEATLATLATMQRHRGHLLNWYDTQTLAPLLPMYVSTVDSGNLSGHLLAVAQACRELALAPLDGSGSLRALAASQARLTPLLAARSKLAPAARDELRWRLADHRATLRSAAIDNAARAGATDNTSPAITDRLLALARALEQSAWQSDFAFLYHRKRHLFRIGYRVAEQQLDAGFYDLLASESRLTSLLAIAKGDVPVSHWSSLGRPFYAVGANAGLRSWSGSMFEYLMPTLVLAEPHGSVLYGACQAAVAEQIAFAGTQGVPWGISESAYAAADQTLAYQYAPQGVPRLALRRTPPDELVIAPYATALAAQVAPRRSVRNFVRLDALVPRGRYGLIEALDFTPARQTASEACTPVATFMAHHQGMSIVALANVLRGGVAQRWGMANAHIEAVASLLHERAPREVSMLYAPPSGRPAQARQRRSPGLLRDVFPGAAALEPTHVLSNGRYSVSLRANGAGWSRHGDVGVTRWRDDALRDAYGSFFYLRWLDDQGTAWQPRPVSITQHPAPDPAAHYHSVYHADRVCFDAAWPELQAHTTVWVSPEDDIEFRQVELRNLGDGTLDIELMSAFEITLSDANADEAHPAFTNLFVQAVWHAEHQALLFARKPRLPTERSLQAAHFLAETDTQMLDVRAQTDRQRWRGRNHDSSQPLASFDAVPAMAPGLEAGLEPSRTTLDTGLDPVCALSVRLRIEPRGKARLTFATAASTDPATLQAVIDKYRQHSNVKRASLMSATLTGIRLRASRLSPESFAAVQTLTTALVLSLTRPQPPMARLRAGGGPGAATGSELAEVCDRRLLWRFGISGDRPILLVSVRAVEAMSLLRMLAEALHLWSWGGIACDLVFINGEAASYQMALQREIIGLREHHAGEAATEVARIGRGITQLHALRADEISDDELSTLQSLARVQLHADGRPLQLHVQEWVDGHEQAFEDRHVTSTSVVRPHCAASGPVPAPLGSFDAASGAFRFGAGVALRPLRPWVNVLANPNFGAQISEAGGGHTWAVNSRMNQLTAWSNDPVADTPSEWFLLQDRKTLRVWSLAPGAWGLEGTGYQISHGQGETVISHRSGELEVTVSWCVDAQTSVKQVRVGLLNHGQRPLHLRLVGIAEWMMGANRSDRASTRTALHRQRLAGASPGGLTALMCTQRERAAGFGDGTAFLALARTSGGADKADGSSGDDSDDWTCDRREFFDARGGLVLPDHFGQRAGAGLDPCAAIATSLTVAAGGSVERVFLLGYAASPAAARQLAATAAGLPAGQRLQQVHASWDHWLGGTTVSTPDPLFDVMVNRWLLYQTLVCRLWSKAGFYQAGGATGFRDQLQDAMALAWVAPDALRRQIVLCASRQFGEGDVQHWWHLPGGAGVRTHFSDDLLWLPYACSHYLGATGDRALLDENVAFLEGAAIPPGAEDAYYTPGISHESASVFEHGARAIDHSLRVGVHGLPLMGSGDWNDGMNRVGSEGRGESVWLGWFLCDVVAAWAPLARERGDVARATAWEEAARGWTAALLGAAWDGQWFKRAYFDDGQPLGSQDNEEARIDLVAQAWSVLSGVAPAALQRMALAAVEDHLVDTDAGLIKLLDPPLAHALPSAGYIQAYPPGVRENGGQYSHAAVWAVMAQARFHTDGARRTTAASDRSTQDSAENTAAAAGDTAYRYFTYLSPAHRAAHPTRGPAYGIEPYVMAGDIYSQPPYVGRGGWSWYTGSAAWMHRAAIESIFGLRQGAENLSFTPCLPSHWPRAELSLRRDGRVLRFILVRAAADSALAEAGALAGATAGAQLLRPGQALNWAALSADACFVIPLLETVTTAPRGGVLQRMSPAADGRGEPAFLQS